MKGRNLCFHLLIFSALIFYFYEPVRAENVSECLTEMNIEILPNDAEMPQTPTTSQKDENNHGSFFQIETQGVGFVQLDDLPATGKNAIRTFLSIALMGAGLVLVMKGEEHNA